MNYLFIVTESLSANGICTHAVMERLAENHGVYCITNREWGMPERFEKNSVNYLTVRPRYVYAIGSMLARREMPEGKRKLWRKLQFVMDRAKLVLSLGSWPLLSPAYARRIETVARRLCREADIGCIVPVYTQIDTLIAANRIKKDHPEVFYIPYFLDALSGGYGLRVFTQEKTRQKGLAWERRLLPNADRIIAMESSRPHHEKYSACEPYFDRIAYFDLPLLRRDPPAAGEPLMNREKCNLVYVGTLPGGIRSPEYLLKVFGHLEGDQYRFWFVGTSDCAALNEAAARDPRIHVVGRCPHELALRYEAQADVLVNIGNTNPNMTPSKIFEYLSFGKPILSTTAVAGEPSLRYLEKYPLALVLDENEADIARTAGQVAAFLERCGGQTADPEWIRTTYYHNTPDALASFLEELDRSREK